MRRSQLTSKCLVACLTTVLFTPLSAKTKTVFTAAGNEMSAKGQNLAQSDSSERYLILTGIIVDTYGEPVPGATVMVKSTRQGTISDVNGHFSIRVKKGDILNISFIGMITQTFVYEGQNNTMITLKENVAEMEEVVVTGTFTRKANTYTGSVTTVSHEKLQSVGNSNIISSLKSIDPSFMIMDNLDLGSNPNALPDIQMRGQTGFSDVVSGQTNPNQPLFILDGFETTLTKILDLDMNLVQSVTLLKDATAKAMYGAKAGNGVIVVETKRPEEGKMRVSYNGNLSVEMPDLTSYNLCNISEKVQAERNAGFYTIKPGESYLNQITLNETYSELMRQIAAGVNTDWLAKPLKTGIGQKHSVYLEGGDKYMLYGVNVSYNDVQGVMKGSNRSTLDGTFSLTYRYKNLQFRNQLSVTNNVANNSPYGSFSSFSLMNPYQAVYDEHGNMLKNCTNGLKSQVNPLWNGQINTIDQSKYTYITENFYAEWRILQNLKLTGRFGVTKNIESSDDFKPSGHTDFYSYSADDLYKAGTYNKTNAVSDNFSGDIGLEYSIEKKKHLLFFNAMASMTQTKYDLVRYAAQGFASDDMKHVSFATEYNGTKPSGIESISRSFGVIGSVNYSYDNRYLFDANIRPNGSSEFGANNRWGYFWSLGAGWNIHNEKFLSNTENINNLKLRFSTGFTGTQGYSVYDAMATLNYYTDQQYAGSIGSYLAGLANPDLKWQKKYDNNIGLDFTLFKNIITGRFDWYQSTTNGLITSVTTPESMGFTSYLANLGESENKGYEGYLSARVYNNNATRSYINIFGSIAHNKNKLKNIANSLKSKNDQADYELNQNEKLTTPSVRYEVGQSMNAIWAVKSMGIDPETGKEVYVKKDGSMTYDWNSADLVVCGDALPTISGNFGVNGEYKGFGLNAAFTWRYGGQLYNTTLLDKVENADVYYQVDKRVLTERWSKPGDISRFKSIADNSYTKPTSRFVEDNNTLTFSSLSLYYDFRDTKIVKNTFFERFKLTLYMNDLFTLSSINIERGTDYPFARSFSLQLQATF